MKHWLMLSLTLIFLAMVGCGKEDNGNGKSPADGGAKSRVNATPDASSPDETETEVKTALSKLNDADRRLAEAQRFCPVHKDSPLGSMGVPVKLTIQGQPVFLCCKGCEKGAKANPAKTLETVAKLKAASK